MQSEELIDSQFEIRVLDGLPVRLFHSSPGDALVRLTIEGDRSWRDVRIARAFPFSNPDRYIGLRDGDDKDIGLVEDLGCLDAESRHLVDEEISRRYFTPKVTAVYDVDEYHGTVTWDVETDRGRRRFVVRNIRDNSYPIGAGRLMMLDTEGNRYEFPNINQYSRKAQEVLARVI